MEADNGIDVAAGIVPCAFASEHPVLRTNYDGSREWEILSHSPGDCNLALLNRAGIVLRDHNDHDPVGEVVHNTARVRPDRKTGATIAITDPALRQRIASGARPAMSVGYRQISIVREERSPSDGLPVRYYSWEPHEISILSKNVEPADASAGLFRSKIYAHT